MRLDRFIGEKVHGFLPFNIRFNKELTFLTGINGSGKTTVLNSIIALITPSLSNLSDLDYEMIRVEFEHEGRKGFIEARKDGNIVFLFAVGADEPFRYSPFVMTSEGPSYREAEFEQEYYRELATNFNKHPVLRFIAELPTPMFLGLDRRARFSEELPRSRMPASRVQSRAGRNVFSASLARSLTDAAGLAETRSRDALIAAGRISEELQRDMLLRLLEVKPTRGFGGTISKPSRAELDEIKAMRQDVEALSQIFRLPRQEVHKRVIPFLDVLQDFANQIPADFDIDMLWRKHKPDEPEVRAILNWSVNSPELRRIRIISEMVAAYDVRKKQLTQRIDRYLELVNGFLKDSGKRVLFDENGYIWINIEGVKGDKPIYLLSSGEAQIFVILTQLSFNPLAEGANVFIIDEPELSLHVQWQELFVDSVISAIPNIQYIMATHSPSIILERVSKCRDISKRKAGRPARG